MSFLNGLFSVLSVVFFICLIIGLVKPSIFKLQTRLKAFLVFCIAIIVSLVGFSVTMSDEQKAQIEEEKKIAEQNAQVERETKEKAKAQEEKLEREQQQTDAKKDQLAEQKLNAEKQAEIQEKELVKLKKLMNSAHLTTASNIPSAKIIPIALALSERKSDVEKSEMHTGQILDIYLKTQGAVWSDANILLMTASAAERVLKELREENVKDLSNVRFHVKTTLVDQYNNKSENKIYTLNYNYSEVLKLNMENTNLYQDYLKFAQFESNGRVGRDVFNAWCSDESNRKWSGNFCYQ